MKNKIKGNLLGYLCDDCWENISSVKVRLYATQRGANVEAALSVTEKDTFRLLSEEEVKQKSNRLIAEALTDEMGNFELEIKDEYANMALEFDFECGTVPKIIPKKPKPPRQFQIATFYPVWEHESETHNTDIRIATSNYKIPAKWWCQIKGRYFDVWTICGKITDCETGKPLVGVNVIAMDADFLTDDVLGNSLSDSNGKFLIYYTSEKFKKTFLSPIINIETDKTGPFASGPDVYFQIEYGGQRYNIETAANRRNNVGYCLCVSLCVKELIVDDTPIPPSFTHFGISQRIPIQSGISNGKASGYAFFASVNLVGSIAKKVSGKPMEYLFEYQEVNNPSDALIAANWLPVKANMINKTIIGYLHTLTGDPLNPVLTEEYFINGSGAEKTITYNGNWIKVPQETNFAPHTDNVILSLNTEFLTDGLKTVDMAMPTLSIGSATVSAARPHILNRYFAIRMRQRNINGAVPGPEFVAGTSKPIAIYNVVFNNVNKNGSWAPSSQSNQRIAASVDIQEIIAGLSGCSKITSALHIKYGVRNENLGSLSLTITGPRKPGQTFNFAPIALMANPETFGVAELVFGTPTETVADLLPCAYTISLGAVALLTTGDGNLEGFHDFVSFCKVD
ncbi:hypothetical protein [Flavobacterium sp.]|uniref:hypothetical protein n=1 Tax=Flavobacterium sp. TaxID=239 RepID=UPI00286A8F82|nr:hypothetical protein [Flavobacterium sp.]